MAAHLCRPKLEASSRLKNVHVQNLPQEYDFSSSYENVLLDTLFQALKDFKACVKHDQHGIVDSVIAMVSNLKSVRECSSSDGFVSEKKLENALRNICSNTLIFYILRL
ncbi:hypothetical protein GX51_07236 [Blastomyces parvus]|uniref:DUF6606 domain-containing protein n=1 Tax=Blastomyces parvus TaxID=2060905 RepID=A0A2B7WLS0_9EURO|nr:hypothetical protein GX51_07236 [Blastomyces parvus]